MARPQDPTLRARILDAAGALFYARGERAVSTAEIIEAAGCGKNALYRHFPTKDALVAAYLREFVAFRDQHVGQALEGATGPAEALVAMTRELAEQAARPTFRGCAVRRCRAADLDGETAATADAALARWRQRVEELVDRLGGPPELAAQVWLIHDGVYAAADPGPAGRTAVGLVEQLVAETGTTA